MLCSAAQCQDLPLGSSATPAFPQVPAAIQWAPSPALPNHQLFSSGVYPQVPSVPAAAAPATVASSHPGRPLNSLQRSYPPASTSGRGSLAATPTTWNPAGGPLLSLSATHTPIPASLDPLSGGTTTDSLQGEVMEAAPLAMDTQEALLPGPQAEFFPTEPVFESIIETNPGFAEEAVLIAPSAHLRPIRREPGIGREYVMHAPFQVSTTQPFNHYRFGLDLAYDLPSPDRSEYFWAGPPRGPRPERSVDYQDMRIKFEVGSPKFSVGTEIPIRVLDPEVNANHAGLGDMNITTKTVLHTGQSWQLTQFLKTYISTGSASMGLGTGHASMEPGMLARYKIDDDNYFHASLTYWFPLGGNPIHGGEVLSQGYAWSHVAYDSDSKALIHSIEAVHWAALDGLRTVAGEGVFDVDGDNILNLYFGTRLISDNGGDFGPVEYGLNWGTALSGNSWYRNLLRFEARFYY